MAVIIAWILAAWAVLSGVIITNLLRQNEQYDDINARLVEKLGEVQQVVSASVGKMREIDLRGAFEADDEVGFTFKSLYGLAADVEKFLETFDEEE
jgi:hypothetical protein